MTNTLAGFLIYCMVFGIYFQKKVPWYAKVDEHLLSKDTKLKFAYGPHQFIVFGVIFPLKLLLDNYMNEMWWYPILLLGGGGAAMLFVAGRIMDFFIKKHLQK